VLDGGVAVQHLQQHQPHRHQRREHPVPPGVRLLAAELIDLPRQGTILQRLAPQPSQNLSDSHPWPPVGW